MRLQASPLLGTPPHCRLLLSPFVPNLAGFIALFNQGPQVPGHPPLLLVLLPRVSPFLAPPILTAPSPPIPPPRTKPPQFLHRRTWPAGRRPPHAGLRPEQEGGGETERDRGKPSWALPQRQPRLRVRPQTRPRPQTHPSTPSKDGAGAAAPCRAARLGWGSREPRSPGRGLEERSWCTGSRAPARPHSGAFVSRRPSPPALPGGAQFGVQGPNGVKRGAARSGAPQWHPGACTHVRTLCA